MAQFIDAAAYANPTNASARLAEAVNTARELAKLCRDASKAYAEALVAQY